MVRLAARRHGSVMDEADDRKASRPGAESIASEVTEHVRAIVTAAEGVADSVKREAEQRAELRLREADAEVARRVRAARAEADDLVVDRRRRIAEVSDAILERADALLARLDEAGAVRSDLDAMLATLGEAAEGVGGRPEEARAEPPAAADPSPPPAPVEPGPVAEEPEPVAEEPASAPEDPASAPEEPAAAPDEPAAEPVDRSNGDSASGEPVPAASERGRNEYGGARQVAVQMAVAGSTRAEVAAHLQRTFDLQDPHTVLNEIFGDSDSPPAE